MASKVIIPDLTGLNKAEATGSLTACNLTLVDGTGSNIRVVTSQSVAPGTIVDVGGSVTVNYTNIVHSPQNKSVMPFVLATTPTVFGGVTYDKWRIANIIGGPDIAPSDKFDLQTPFSLVFTFAKGTYTADGYWQDSPVDAEATATISDVALVFGADTLFANYLELVAGYIANRAKNAGIL